MHALRHVRPLAIMVLVWFAMSLGAAIASPIVQPKTMQLVCTSAGAVKVIVQTDDGALELGAGHLDCPLCALMGGPPPATPMPGLPHILPLGHAVQPIPAARIAAATAAPLPARGPPSLLLIAI